VGVPLEIPSSRPTLEQLQSCFPRRARIPSARLWQPFDGPVAPVASSSSSAGGARRKLVEDAVVLKLGRTRAAHKLAEASQAAVAIAGPAEAVVVQPLVARGRRLPRARAVVEELS
jgi:hypothetical protein